MCPSCSIVESHDHIIRCKCVSKIIIKSTWMEKFDLFLSNERHTPPIVRTIIVDHNNNLSIPDHNISYRTNLPHILEAIHDQENIG
jgi:hypothetical protein